MGSFITTAKSVSPKTAINLLFLTALINTKNVMADRFNAQHLLKRYILTKQMLYSGPMTTINSTNGRLPHFWPTNKSVPIKYNNVASKLVLTISHYDVYFARNAPFCRFMQFQTPPSGRKSGRVLWQQKLCQFKAHP